MVKNRLPWSGSGRKKCTQCDAMSLASIKVGTCSYHWLEGIWGKQYADRIYPSYKEHEQGSARRFRISDSAGQAVADPVRINNIVFSLIAWDLDRSSLPIGDQMKGSVGKHGKHGSEIFTCTRLEDENDG